MATVSITGINKKKGISIYLAINHGRNKRKLISLGLTVAAKHWNKNTNEIRKSHKNYVRLNRLIGEALGDATAVLDEMTAGRRLITVETVAENIRSALFVEKDTSKDEDFLSFCDRRLQEYFDRERYSTFAAYRTAVNKLKNFTKSKLKRSTLPYELFTVEYLRSFHTHLIKDIGNAPNTVHKNLTSIRTLFYDAIRSGYVSRNDDPFFSIRIKREKTSRDRITGEEFVAIESAELKDEGAEDTRREFLFAYYAGGMRFSDICLFKWSHVRFDGKDYRSKFKMKKVSDTAGLVLVPKALEILSHYGNIEEMTGKDEYVFYPLRSRKRAKTAHQIHKAIASANVIANKNLKKIQKIAGIQTKLTTHMARHSIAKMLDDQGWDIYDIMKILGHSKVSTTQEYLRGFQSTRLDSDFRDVFEQ